MHVFIYVNGKKGLQISSALIYVRAVISDCMSHFIFYILISSRGYHANISLAVLPKVSTQTRQVDEDFTSFISFSSCDVTWRPNFIPSFSFHFIKTSREREASYKLVKKRCRGGGYRRVIIVVYVEKSVGNSIRCVS